MADGPQNIGVGRGLLWGCFAPVLAVVLLVLGWFTYNTYYYTSGYKEAAGLPAAMKAVNASPVATHILGNNIQIQQMELNMAGEPRKGGRRIFYKVRVRGSKAEGQIQTSVLIIGQTVNITDLKLISYDGTPHNLLPLRPKP
jgi:hypothetical protein